MRDGNIRRPVGMARSAILEALETRTHLSAALNADIMSYSSGTGQVSIDYNNDRVADRVWTTDAGSQVLAGDFDGNTVSDLISFINGRWTVDLNSDGGTPKIVHFGNGTHTPVTQDLNGDGKTDLLVYEASTGIWSVDMTRDGRADIKTFPYFTFGGQAGDVPLAGDLNGDGRGEVMIYRAGTWMVDSNLDGKMDSSFKLSGAPTNAKPFLVNWNGDYRSHPGVVSNGTWYIDTDGDRKVDKTFSYGAAGDRPLTGFINTANSIFVKLGAQGSGTVDSPLGKIQDAIFKHKPGQIIRVALGKYVENLVAYKTTDMTIVGVGRNATRIQPASGDAIHVVLGSNTWFHNLRFSGGGRGLISLGGDVHARYISTSAVKNDGVVANDSGSPEIRASKLDFAYCSFNSALYGYGMWLQGNTQADIYSSTFTNNGSSKNLTPGGANGRGIVIEGHSNVTLRKNLISANYDTGLSVLEYAHVEARNTTMRNNKHGNGALILDNATVDFENCRFDRNGLVRDPNDLSAGRNGIEFYLNYRGSGARLVNNVFKENTGFGVFVAGGTGHVITGNTFDNNWCGIGVEGANGHAVSATVQGNTFQVLAGSTYEHGALIYGPNATVKLGGDLASQKNTFKNYRWKLSIDISPYTAGGVYQGYPVMDLELDDNVFINSPDPIRYE